MKTVQRSIVSEDLLLDFTYQKETQLLGSPFLETCTCQMASVRFRRVLKRVRCGGKQIPRNSKHNTQKTANGGKTQKI
eukprot:4730523-Amphidinium_carterae.1